MTAGSVHISSKITEARYGHAWRDDERHAIFAVITLGDTDLTFYDAATARHLAAECIKAAGALDALAEPGPAPAAYIDQLRADLARSDGDQPRPRIDGSINDGPESDGAR